MERHNHKSVQGLRHRRQRIARACVLVAPLIISCASRVSGNGDEDPGAAEHDAGPSQVDGCLAPDVLIVLDRTGTMLGSLDGSVPASVQDSRWAQAVTAIETLVSSPGQPPQDAPIDGQVRFGLELFPTSHPSCVTVSDYMAGIVPTNPTCQSSELLVAPAAGTADAIEGALDPNSTVLCDSTPISTALVEAGQHLEAVADGERPQYILLLTDGVDVQTSYCESTEPSGAPQALVTIQRLAEQQNIQTFVVGFGPDFDESWVAHTMNNLACAGHTAPDPEQNCVDGFEGLIANPQTSASLYLHATNGAELTDRLTEIVGGVCCGCSVE